MKIWKIFFLCACLVLSACSKNKNSENQNIDSFSQNDKEEKNVSVPEKDYLSMDEYLSEHFKSYEKGGINIHTGLIYDVPDEFSREVFSLFGIEGDYIPPEKPYEEIEITFLPYLDSLLHIMIPNEVHDINPEVYLEAQHDGKSFFYNNKSPLKMKTEKNFDGEQIGYHGSYIFNNRNMYSSNDKWDIFLRSCSTDEILYKQTFSLKFWPQDYIVYSQEYEDPFVLKENRKLEIGENYHLIYKGKGRSRDGYGTMVVFSYCYQSDNKDAQVVYFPLFGVIPKIDIEGVCDVEFSIKEPGQYKIDFYDYATGEVIRNDALHFIQVMDGPVKHVENPGTKWKVSSPEGLRLRNCPWGDKIGLLENETELIQTEETLYPFYDFIDEVHGFWIPVRIQNKTQEYENLSKEKLICFDSDKTDGWVFSGFLEKIE